MSRSYRKPYFTICGGDASEHGQAIAQQIEASVGRVLNAKSGYNLLPSAPGC